MARNLESDSEAKHNGRENMSLELYLREINRIPLMNKNEEREVAALAKDGDEQAVDKLVRANLRFVVSVAKRYANQGVPIEDLINDGNLGLIKAARRFDVERGFKFISYAVWWIRQAMLQSLSQSSRIVRLPLNRAGVLYKIGRASRDLDQKLGREPTVEEIAKEIGVPTKEVEDTMHIQNTHVSLDEKLSGEQDDLSSMEYLVDERAMMPDDYVESDKLSENISNVLDTLPDRQRVIIELYYGLDGEKPLTLEQIGERFGLTRERIRQLKEQAIQRLRHRSRAKYFDGYDER